MSMAIDFTASLCGGWLTDDDHRLVRRWLLGRRETSHAVSAATRNTAPARNLTALQERWFHHMVHAQAGREWLPLEIQLARTAWAFPRS